MPVSSLVGQENDGWTVAKHLLKHERSGSYGPRLRLQIRRMRAMLAARDADGDPARQDDLRRELTVTEMGLDALEATEQRILSSLSSGQPPGPESSLMKVQGTELRQRLDEITLAIAGPYAAPDQSAAIRAFDTNAAIGPVDVMTAASKYLNNRAASIYAGSNEIQRNIMAAQVLKL